jgi:hypothetical protein
MNVRLNTEIAVLLLPFVVLAQNRAASTPPQQAANSGFTELLNRPRLFPHSQSWHSTRSAPAIPPGAQAAGFTTLSFNADFSLPEYANALNNSWLCNRADDDVSHFCEWYDGVWWNANVPLDGNGDSTIGQVFDSTIGRNVLEMT